MSNKFELPDNLKTATIEQWHSLVERALNGSTIDEKLTFQTYDDIQIKPLYTKADEVQQSAPIQRQKSTASATESISRPWKILQLIDVPALKAANEQISTDINGGASGLVLAISNDIPYASAELPLYNLADYQTLFASINITGKSLYFTNGREGLVNAANFISYATAGGLDLSTIDGSFGFDPLSLFASQGHYPEPEDEAFDNWLDAAAAIEATGSKMTPFLASGRTWQQAGASEAMELGFTLAALLSYVRALEKSGMTTAEAFKKVDISLTTSSDIFLSTAKLRAMRLLWSKVYSASLPEQAQDQDHQPKLIAEMSYLGLTRADPEVNMLRATVATVAAGLGNADALVLLPFSAAHGVASKAARRLALNTQIIAQEESHIGKVEDPARGSWYVENLTSQLAKKAWAVFQKTECSGGLTGMLKSGAIKTMIDEKRETQTNDISQGNKQITGVTIFPNINETPPDLFEDEDDSWQEVEASSSNVVPTLKAPIVSGGDAGARFKDIQEVLGKGTPTYIIDEALEGPATIKTMIGDIDNRIVEDIEFLRNLSDEILAEKSIRPNVFLANLGTASEFTARATWAKSYFETGGIEASGNEGFTTIEQLVEGYTASGATIACLCSTDARYSTDAANAARALLKHGAEAIYIVARPSFLKTIAYEDRSLFQTLLYQGTDMVSTLVEAHQIIGFADDTIAV